MVGGNLKMSVLKLITVIDTVETYLNNHSVKDIKVLAILYWNLNKNEASYNSLLEATQISPVSLTRSIKLLQDRGIIDLKIDEKDTRRKIVCLTEKGKALKLDLLEIMG